jgi:hypothetical protein
MLKVSLKYGISGGVLSVLLFAILYLLDQNPLVNAKKIDIPLFLIFILFSVKEFRDAKDDNRLTIWEGFLCGGMTFLTMALISSLFMLVFLKINDAMVTDYVDNSIEYLNENKERFLEKRDIQSFNEVITNLKSTSIVDLAVDDFLKKSRIGIFLTIIVSVVLRKQPTLNQN